MLLLNVILRLRNFKSFVNVRSIKRKICIFLKSYYFCVILIITRQKALTQAKHTKTQKVLFYFHQTSSLLSKALLLTAVALILLAFSIRPLFGRAWSSDRTAWANHSAAWSSDRTAWANHSAAWSDDPTAWANHSAAWSSDRTAWASYSAAWSDDPTAVHFFMLSLYYLFIL